MTNFELIKTKVNHPISKLECNCPSFDFEVSEITEGSEKQIDWARKIQYTYVLEFSKWAREMENNNKIKNADMVKNLFSKIFSKISAKYWIDNKDKNIQLIMQENMK